MDNDDRRRNLLTEANHAKDTFWQISFPLILGILVILALAGWTIFIAAAGGQIGQFADASLILLTIPAMIVAFIFLAILAGIAYLVIWLNKNLAFYTYRLQKIFGRIAGQVDAVADKAARPIIKVKCYSAVFRAFLRAFSFSR